MKRNTVYRIAAVLCLVALLFSGCGKAGKSEADHYNADEYRYSEIAEQFDAEYALPASEAKNYSKKAGASVTGNTKDEGSDSKAEDGRKLVKTMAYSMESKEFDGAVANIRALVAAAGGYVESSSIDGGGSGKYATRRASFTLRIPVGRLADFAEELGRIGNVLTSSENVKDITLSYTDTASRIKALETQRDSLLNMMAKAEKLEELLVIQDKLTDVEYQLEYYASQLRLMDNQVEYSSISVSLREVKDFTEPEPDPETFWERLAVTFKESLESAKNFLENTAIFLIGKLPVLLIWAVIIVLIVVILKKCFRSRRARKTARKAAKQAEKEAVQEDPAQL